MIEPLGDRVMVKQFCEEQEITKSGIILNPIEQKRKNAGEIVAIGCGEKVKKLNLSVGNKVIFEGYGGEPVDEEFGKNLFILNFDKLIARYE